ncbi:unnamed protein product [Adineta steineri]|uniref:UMOD/GP2/OIT3-like D8C domain-containing protein n=1 Tax=Adineta steineri TaxID=433720 RepID=A0A815XRF7_9BILA|nr:unnamed protein product [Adineta steineri]CAF1561471.1 unnamed protein product [Adineta steineri]
MTYSPTDPPLAQLIIKHKMLCAAQCAYEYPDCNTAVYDSSAVPQCLLFSAPLAQVNLISSINAVVYDFQESKFRATTSTTTTSTTTTTTTSTTTTTTTTTSTTTTTTSSTTTSTTTTTTTTSTTTTTTTTTTSTTTKTTTTTTTTTTKTTTTTTTTATTVPPQCSSYTMITNGARNVYDTSGVGYGCDAHDAIATAGWYRFSGASGTRLANYAVSPGLCASAASGWYGGTYPSTAGSTISGTVCYNYSGNTCYYSSPISVTYCAGGYYVYYLPPPPTCDMRYCTM